MTDSNGLDPTSSSSSSNTNTKTVDPADTPPPGLSSWSRAYALVLGELALLVVLFYALTRWAS